MRAHIDGVCMLKKTLCFMGAIISHQSLAVIDFSILTSQVVANDHPEPQSFRSSYGVCDSTRGSISECIGVRGNRPIKECFVSHLREKYGGFFVPAAGDICLLAI